MKKTLLLTTTLTACLLGATVSTGAEDETAVKQQAADQKAPPNKAPAPRTADPAARSTNAQKEADAKTAAVKREKSEATGKVSINHKGRVISVDESAVKAHLAHGDTVVSDGSAHHEKSKEGGKGKHKDKHNDKEKDKDKDKEKRR